LGLQPARNGLLRGAPRATMSDSCHWPRRPVSRRLRAAAPGSRPGRPRWPRWRRGGTGGVRSVRRRARHGPRQGRVPGGPATGGRHVACAVPRRRSLPHRLPPSLGASGHSWLSSSTSGWAVTG